MKKRFFAILPLFAIFLFAYIFTPASRAVEIQHIPYLQGMEELVGSKQDANTIPGYIIRLYQFTVGIAGVLAVGMIVAGSIYITVSAGSPDKQNEGKDIITSAIWGIVLLLGSYLILKTINPELVNLKVPGKESEKVPKISFSTANSYQKCFVKNIIAADSRYGNEKAKTCDKLRGGHDSMDFDQYRQCIDNLNKIFVELVNECNKKFPGGGGYAYSKNDQNPVKCLPFYDQNKWDSSKTDNKINIPSQEQSPGEKKGEEGEWKKGEWSFC